MRAPRVNGGGREAETEVASDERPLTGREGAQRAPPEAAAGGGGEIA